MPVIFYLFFQKKNKDKSLRVIFFLLIPLLLIDLYGAYSIAENQSNAVFFNIYSLIETLGVLAFYYHVLVNKSVKKILLILIAALFSFWIYQFVIRGESVFFIHFVLLETIAILFFSIHYYYQQLAKVSSAFIYLVPQFWVVTAYFVYIAGTFFLILYLPSLTEQERSKYLIVSYIFTIIRTILLTIAMLMHNDNSRIRSLN